LKKSVGKHITVKKRLRYPEKKLGKLPQQKRPDDVKKTIKKLFSLVS
jgi:hypothetical protein